MYWDAGTARLLPRLIRDRTRGPVFVTHRRPGPGKYLADRDVCPDTGLARLSYDQARDLLDAATGTDGPGHRLGPAPTTPFRPDTPRRIRRQPARTHGQVRHRKAGNLRRYFKPSPQAMRELTSILGPGAERRR
ncbi:hypothetical protein [Nocardia cyriacigeorgica]|uniref:hypothetical protein n=1 Tax=Nocardia cyriacigeorgica TaxID=135487 RepID=UPI002458A169|nr:hypothetical protein [Nocardia cyriacigeorgica]